MRFNTNKTCSHCGYIFSTGWNLNRHVAQFHTLSTSLHERLTGGEVPLEEIASPTIIVPIESIVSGTTKLSNRKNDLDKAMSDVLNQDLNESDKAETYLKMLRKFLMHSIAPGEKSRHVPIASVDYPIWNVPTLPGTALEGDLIEPIKNVSSGGKQKPMQNVKSGQRMHRKLSIYPVKTKRWSKYG